MTIQMNTLFGVSLATAIGIAALPVAPSSALDLLAGIGEISAAAAERHPAPRPAVRDHRTKPTVRDHRAEPVVRDHRTKPTVRDHRTMPVVRDHRTKPSVRDHRTRPAVRDHRTNTSETVKVKRLPCIVGSRELRGYGFHNIHNTGCDVPTYLYLATKNGKVFAVTMHAYSGAMNAEFIRFAE